MTQSPTRIRELLRRFEVVPRRSLGQHFLADPNVVHKIASLVPAGLPVVEVGAGTGALTLALAEGDHRIISYEIDERLRPLLEEVLGDHPNVEVRYQDVTKVDLSSEIDDGEWTLAGNLPYHIATPLLGDVLRGVPMIKTMVVMLQREVGDRLVAHPGTKAYGIPSVVVQLHARPSIRFAVPPQLFIPPPAVSSVVMTLDRHDQVPAAAGRAVELAAAAFGQRRKMIRTSLAGTIGDLGRVAKRAGIDERLRSDALKPADYLALAEAEAR